ncbi:hypothetical protein CUMW_111770 [Citrus unshiu]|nr:hypothetical protein CUMW_111770 [Citrus unshiu]
MASTYDVRARAIVIINGAPVFSSSLRYPCSSATFLKQGWRRDLNVSLVTRRTKGQAFQVLANPNWLSCFQPPKSYKPVDGSGECLTERLSSFLGNYILITAYVASISPRTNDSSKKIIMVDPLEAKRLANKQMQEIQAKEKFKRRRQIEAINGAWAMIGLTVGLVIEGQTGKNIIEQLAGYWSSIVHFFSVITECQCTKGRFSISGSMDH